MAVQLILKNSSVEDRRPTAAQLTTGELALNYNEEGAFLSCKDSAGNIQQVGGVKIAEAAPSAPVEQTLWFQPSTRELRVYNGSNWAGVSAAILPDSIVNADINSAAGIAVSKLGFGSARQLLQTAASGIDVEFASNIDIPGTLDVTNAATFDNNVTIQGDLVVHGTTTTIDSTTLLVKDKNIEMGVVATPTDTTADGGGITLKGTTDKTINWIDSTNAWTFSEHVNIVSAKEYRIAGTKVLDATSLGSAVVSSSLTSVGTIGTGVWNGTAIATAYIADSAVTSVKIADGAISSVKIADSAVTSSKIADGAIVNADVNASAAIADTKLSTISTAGKVSNSATTATAINTGSAIVSRDGSGSFSAGTVTAALTGNASTATALETARDIGGVSFDGTASINLPGVNAAGNQDTSGNAATSTALNSARNFAVTGDVTGTVSSDLTSGASIATSIAAGAIVNADVNASAAITGSKITTGTTSAVGVLQLTDSTSSTSTTTAATPNAVKTSFDLAGAALPKAGGTMTGDIVFNSGQTIAGYTPRTGATGSAQLPAGTELQRDFSPSAGFIRFNTDVTQFEGYTGTAWASVGGGATGGGSNTWALEHDNTITDSYSISSGKNVISAGPLTVNSGATVTVPSGSNWVIA